MEEQIISFKTAKLAKEKGFNGNTYKWYYHNYGLNGKLDSSTMGEDFLFTHSKRGKLYYSAPTQSLLQKWLREEHKLHITIFSSSQESWMFRITKPHQSLKEGEYGEDYYSYEECLEECLQEALNCIL